MTIEAPFELDRGSTSLSLEPEEWRPIPGFEDAYEVSSSGRLRSLGRPVAGKSGSIRTLRGQEIRPRVNNSAYLIVTLSRDGIRQTRLVHRLVCEAFNGPPPEGKPYALHGDGNRKNNRRENVRWGSQSDNLKDAIRHGTYTSPQSLKTKCKRGHPFTEDNTYRPPSGGRYCRRCRVMFLDRMKGNR